MHKCTEYLPDFAPLSVIPCTPPPSYPATFASPTSYFTPAAPSRREVIMGGLVSPGPLVEGEEYDEKRGMSIEVPGIVLSTCPSQLYTMLIGLAEPHCELTLPSRAPSPPPKSILLLPPTSLSLPIEPVGPYRPYSPRFAAILSGNGRSGTCLGTTTIRSMVLLLMLAVGGWHLWSTMQCGTEELPDWFEGMAFGSSAWTF